MPEYTAWHLILFALSNVAIAAVFVKAWVDPLDMWLISITALLMANVANMSYDLYISVLNEDVRATEDQSRHVEP